MTMPECIPLNPKTPRMFSEEPAENDERIFEKITSIHLTPEQIDRIVNPTTTYPRQENVLAVHWHPEHISLHLIEQRIQRIFPNRKESLIIPTQHNELLNFHEYAGVEVDAYSKGFNQKVQLLLHFHLSRIQSAHVLKSMLAYTFRYRQHQMNRFLDALIEPNEDIIESAASETGANDECIRFVRAQMKKLALLIEHHYDRIPIEMFKNKLLRDFLDEYRPEFGDAWINRAQIFLHAVKQLVKAQFPLRYFYRTSEIIEEARSLGGGIVIPHPEQFWPILLADYDVDGYEIWNPQSRRYTEFLISVINRKNALQKSRDRRLLLLMGDDTHMGEKVRDPDKQVPEKAKREIGVQPAWEDMDIQKALIAADMSRKRVIEEYKARLGEEPVKSDPKQQISS
uniref:Uncharacterized protein n=1 Tax=Desulfatirhabdium butyrativorans TaxID=340467 RepID=A0A7C4RT97_9BACT